MYINIQYCIYGIICQFFITYSNHQPGIPNRRAFVQLEIGIVNQRTLTIFTLLFSSVLILVSTFADAATWTGRASYYRARTRMGCAHRFLPFGTRVKVTNLRNGHQLILTINDRGPFIRGRIVDVSTRAAEMLGFRHAGIVPVRVETITN